MLYQLHEMQYAAFEPVRVLADAAQRLYQHPFNLLAYTRMGRAVAASAEMTSRTVRRYAKPEWGLPSTVIDGRAVAVIPEVVLAQRFCNLVHFKRDTRRQDPRVLLVAPLSGHYASLLRGTVEGLLPDHDVHITDWLNARNVPAAAGPYTLDDYIDGMMNFIEMLGPEVHVIAVCQPAVPVMAAVSLMAEDGNLHQPRTMTLMGGPIDTRINPTKVNEVAHKRPLSWFEKGVIAHVPIYYPGFMRRVYPGFMQLSGFMSLNIDRHVGAHLNMFRHLIEGDGDSADAHREFYDEYMSVMDLPAEYYLQTLQTVFMEHRLPRGLMTWRGRPVRPEAISRTALMTVEGEKDDITGPGQTKAAHALCSGIAAAKRDHHLQEKVGHYGVFNGRRFRVEVLPRIRAFIRKHA